MLHQIETAFRGREASEARLRRFVADASHELRTPLTTIRGYAELFRQGAMTDPEEQARALDRIETESVRMGLLVDDLLLLARLDQQRPLQRKPIDLGSLAAEAIEDARAADTDRTYDLAPSTGPTEVLGDGDRLHQVLANLLANVREHCPPGTRAEVSVTSTELAEPQGTAPRPWVQVDVTDDGPGLDPEQLTRVFERFYRTDGARTRWRQRPGSLDRAGRGRGARRSGRVSRASWAAGRRSRSGFLPPRWLPGWTQATSGEDRFPPLHDG